MFLTHASYTRGLHKQHARMAPALPAVSQRQDQNTEKSQSGAATCWVWVLLNPNCPGTCQILYGIWLVPDLAWGPYCPGLLYCRGGPGCSLPQGPALHRGCDCPETGLRFQPQQAQVTPFVCDCFQGHSGACPRQQRGCATHYCCQQGGQAQGRRACPVSDACMHAGAGSNATGRQVRCPEAA
jgi:hypothetical protein